MWRNSFANKVMTFRLVQIAVQDFHWLQSLKPLAAHGHGGDKHNLNQLLSLICLRQWRSIKRGLIFVHPVFKTIHCLFANEPFCLRQRLLYPSLFTDWSSVKMFLKKGKQDHFIDNLILSLQLPISWDESPSEVDHKTLIIKTISRTHLLASGQVSLGKRRQRDFWRCRAMAISQR